MRLLKATDELKNLLDRFVYKNNSVEFLKDVNDNWVLPEGVKSLEHLQPYLSQMEVIDSTIDEGKTQLARAKERVKLRITDLAYSGSSFKDYKAIDYTVEVKKLHAKREFSKEGFLTLVIWYEEPEFINEVLKVEIAYTTDAAEPIPAAKSVISRKVTRKWKSTNTADIHITDVDGTVIQSVTFTNGYPDDSSFHKITEKHYNTSHEKREEGKKRRSNIIVQVGDGLGYQMYMAGITDIEEKLAAFTVLHASALATYRETGKGKIYDDVANDTQTTWLTADMKSWTVSKLRGEI